ncbi:unnamed protein product [Bursaphelenchus xylophilus]|uniref:(pine wood nematode) hypothetical protein n=1 Tax=Bursaphelenchus xylophilus TaxID=6326 RepID=A0A1I7S6J2_BURXY|nr:unnamed protein product [Bursaphelenchus xylophilus]CAG9120492.1 unnamed protein product [Bursaphelenchus xylophilus]
MIFLGASEHSQSDGTPKIYSFGDRKGPSIGINQGFLQAPQLQNQMSAGFLAEDSVQKQMADNVAQKLFGAIVREKTEQLQNEASHKEPISTQAAPMAPAKVEELAKKLTQHYRNQGVDAELLVIEQPENPESQTQAAMPAKSIEEVLEKEAMIPLTRR